MAYYSVCSSCGCNLDPGEKCDCEEDVQKKEHEIQRMIFVGRNGQMTFAFVKEERSFEKVVV